MLNVSHMYKDVGFKTALKPIQENKEFNEPFNFRKYNRVNQQLCMRKPVIKVRVIK